MRAMQRPAGAHAAVPARRVGARRSSRSACPTTRPTGSRRRSSARRTAPSSRALVAADLAHVRVGGEPRLPRLPRVAGPRRRSRARRRAAHRSRPATRVSTSKTVRRPRREVQDAARRARHRRATRRPPATAASTCTCGSSRVGTPYQVRSAAVAVARELARRRPDVITDAWWKEERGERVFIDFNQNAPHKTVFGAWSARARARCAGVDAVPRGTSSTRSIPDALTIATVPAASPTRRRPVGRRSTTSCSRSSRSSRCTNATCAGGPAPTRRGRPCTRRCRASRRASRRAGPRRHRRRRPPRSRRRSASAG